MTPSDGVRRYLSLDSSRERIENEVLAYVSSEFGQDIAAAAKPIITAAIRARPGIRPGVGIEPVIQLETRRSELRGTVGLDFPVDLSPLPLGQVAARLVREPKFYVRLEAHVSLTPKQFRLKMLDARVGFSMRPIGSDNAKDIHWGKTFRP